MINTEITTVDNKEWVISGLLSLDTVSMLCDKGKQIIAKHDAVKFNLRNVTYSDSAGVALLLVWASSAIYQGKNIKFLHLPAQMKAIVQVCGLSDVLRV